MRSGSSRASSRSTAGFTLIEILVVLVIVGVALSFATLSINPTGADDRLNDESQRLSALVQTAADEAILSGHTIGLEIGRDGYRFVELNEAGWKTITGPDSPLRPRRLGDGIHLDRLSLDGQNESGRQANRQSGTLTLPPSPVPPTPGEAREQAEQRAEARQDDHPPLPAALFLSSGELLPFRLELSADDVDHRFDIDGAPNGDITMQRIER
ncbi:type II secretion system minor pseudopilin GspH [Salinisphaera sp. Q1T1-3]|uniref:type II secretion system minor pseudopilin GspH n=1 Tax=Salinisphaera sp. Q1T1-3 TaxID=2321229 RepID=UPI0013143AE6|nr:type II secretion system minor pseudopilin GspH [Salinisphaera sp. Q1T1-3]